MFETLGMAALSRLLVQVGSTLMTNWFLKVPPVLQASKRVAASHPFRDTLEPALPRWLNSPQFKTAAYRLREGQTEVDLIRLTTALIESGFAAGDQTEQQARQVVDAFFRVLEEELLKSPEAVLYAQRALAGQLKTVDENVSTKYDHIVAVIEELPSRIGSLVDSQAATDEIGRRITAARDQLLAGKPATARHLLNGIAEELGQRPTTNEIRFRILTNLACCELQLDRRQEAAERFEAAFHLNPTDPKAIANRGLARYLRGDEAGARHIIDSLLAEHPGDPTGFSVLVTFLASEEELPGLAARFETTEDDRVRETVAEIYLKLGDPASCLRVLSTVRTPLSAGRLLLECEARFALADHHFKRVNPLPWLLPPILRKGLEENEARLSELIDLTRAEWPVLLRSALTLRGYNRAFLVRHEDACKDLREALPLYATPPADLLLNLAMFEIINERPADAVVAARGALALRPEHTRTRLVLAEGLLRAGEAEEAVRVGEEAAARALDLEEQVAALVVKSEALTNMGRHDEAYSELATAIRRAPESDEVLAALAQAHAKQGQAEKALKLALLAMEKAPAGRKSLARLRLADIAFKLRNYGMAAEHYRLCVDATVASESLARLVIALYESKQYEEALEVSRRAREGRQPLETISEVEGAILEQLGDLDRAKQLYEEMIAARVAESRALERLATVLYRQGKVSEVQQVLHRLRPRIAGDANALMACSHLHVAVGDLDAALALAYQALGLGQADPKIHLAYMFVIHAIPEPRVAEFTPTQVGPSTAVTVESEGEPVTFVLGSDAASVWNDEIQPATPLAQRLLGRSVGDTVAFGMTPLGERTGIISAVRHKYIARYQTALSEFNRRFPDAAGLWKVKVDESLTDVKKLIDHRARATRAVLERYQAGELTVGAMAGMVGSSTIDTWLGLMGRQDIAVAVCPSNQEALQEGVRELKASTDLVLDPTSGLTLLYAGHLEVLGRLGKTFYVPQQVVDMVVKEIDDRRTTFPTSPVIVVGKEGDTYVRSEVTAEDNRQFSAQLEKLLGALRSCRVVGVSANSPVFQDPQVPAVLGKDFASCLAVALEHKAPIISDDAFFRALAWNDWKIRVMSSSELLACALEEGRLTPEAFEDTKIDMVRWRFEAITISSATLLAGFRRDGYSVGPNLGILLSVLADLGVDRDAATSVAVSFLRDVWTLPLLTHQIKGAARAVLDALIKARGPGSLTELRRRLRVALRLVPAVAAEADQFVERFAAERRNGSLLL
jgi:tetratricopeptide (TPR) repeat protein